MVRPLYRRSGVAFNTFASLVFVVRSERLNFSSAKYGPTVSSGVTVLDPELEVVPLEAVAEVLLPPQPLSLATPAPPRISIRRRRVSCEKTGRSLMCMFLFVCLVMLYFVA
jgi:hypothetical protein